MVSLEDEESKFAALLGLDVSQAIQIPRSLRKILFDRFTKIADEEFPSTSVVKPADNVSETHRIKQLESEIQSLREKLANKSAHSELNSSGSQHQQGTIDMGYSSFSTQDIDVSDLPIASTATDALASEAAFMENIGLYLNPKQSLTKGRATFQRERTASDCLEAADILMWCDQTTNDIPNFSDSPAKSKPQQQSLLSFLHKSKLSSNDLTEKHVNVESDQADSVTGSSSSVKWRLWNPEQENELSQEDELWNDIVFSSAAEFIAHETADPAADAAAATVTYGNIPDKKSTDSSEYFCKPCGRVLGRYVPLKA